MALLGQLRRMENRLKTLSLVMNFHTSEVPTLNIDSSILFVQWKYFSCFFQAQLVVLACQVSWSQYTEAALQKGDSSSVQQVLRVVEATLNVLADSVLHEQPAVRRRKLEHLVRNIFWNIPETGKVLPNISFGLTVCRYGHQRGKFSYFTVIVWERKSKLVSSCCNSYMDADSQKGLLPPRIFFSPLVDYSKIVFCSPSQT